MSEDDSGGDDGGGDGEIYAQEQPTLQEIVAPLKIVVPVEEKVLMPETVTADKIPAPNPSPQGLKVGEVNPTTRPATYSMGIQQIPKEKKSSHGLNEINPTAPPANF